MRSNSGSEKGTGSLIEGRLGIILLAAVLLVLSPAGRPAMSAVSLAQMARILASGASSKDRVPDVFRGYSRLGLRREAAEYLGRQVQLAAISREEAVPLFEEVIREQSRWDDPTGLAAICETAIRNGAGTALAVYSYGTALRQSGRLAEASSIFSGIDPDSPYYPYALYALGQIAVEEGHGDSAAQVFDRVRGILRERKAEGAFARRVALSQAELLLTLGRPADASAILASIPRDGDDPIAEIARAAAGSSSGPGELHVSPEIAAGWPVKRRILLDLLQGGVALDGGRFTDAIDRFNRAEEKIQSSLASSAPSVAESVEPHEPVDLLRRQVEHHRHLRSLVPAANASAPVVAGEQAVETLVDLLFIDRSIARTRRSLPETHAGPGMKYLSRSQVEEIIQTIERTSLEGVDVDRLVEELAKKLDIFQNLAHPIDRYRLLSRLEKSQAEIRAIRRRIHKHRESAIAGIKEMTGEDVSISRFLDDMGRFLSELDALGKASREVRRFTGRNFDILRTKDSEGGQEREAFGNTIRRALEIDGEGFRTLLPSVRTLEDEARIISWERKKQEISALRPMVSRRIVDGLLLEARFHRGQKTAEGQLRARASVERAVSYVRGGSLSGQDRVESAIQIGSYLIQGENRWEPLPGGSAGKQEKEAIVLLLPILDGIRNSEGLREEAAYLAASLRIRAKDPDAKSAAERFLREFPSSPFAGRIAVRMGHEAFLAGRSTEALSLYRRAGESPEPATAAVARYMMGWFRFQSGDASAAARELSTQLSDPGFPCRDPSPFEKSVLDLAVRAWGDSRLDGLDSYPPVRGGMCGGRALLLTLGKNEERRGEAGRSALVYGVLAERFSDEDDAPAYERKAVDSLLQAGKEDQAFARILRLEGKYGPGTEWSKSRSSLVREKAREEIVAMLRVISERKFEEGVRTGEAGAMAAAKTGMERLLSVREADHTGEDAELRLKLAIASLKAGDREKGIAVLRELAERGAGVEGEQAAVLYAETRIAAYERKEDTAEGAEDSARLLLSRYPSEKAAGLAYRAAAALLSDRKYDQAMKMAEMIEHQEGIPESVLLDTRLVYAESAVYSGKPVAARESAGAVLGNPSPSVKPASRERAKNLFVLATLKEIEAKTLGQDWSGAGRMLEELGRRFPEDPEAPEYFLRAFRSYRTGGDMEAASRVGKTFLDDFPARKEAVEITGALGAHLVEQGESGRAADLYARTAERLPKNPESQDLLFLAARLSKESGDPEKAVKRFGIYREKYPLPRWRSVYATISIGLLSWARGDAGTAVRELEEGLRAMDGGLETDAPRDVFEAGGNGILVLGQYWAEQFRKLKLVPPLEKNLAIKDRFFRRALALFDKADRGFPPDVAVQATLMAGDLFIEYGKSVLEAQRPKGLSGEEGERFETALSERAAGLFEKGMDRYAGALVHLEEGGGAAEMAAKIRERIENAQVLLAGTAVGGSVQ
ncbi:MAG TPA: hypothetical protein VE080_00675 [Candidatus Aquicultoraceae bacterium]|nr:hypothetical protein [Candidatus Aquicultoraceae bacterium]